MRDLSLKIHPHPVIINIDTMIEDKDQDPIKDIKDNTKNDHALEVEKIEDTKI